MIPRKSTPCSSKSLISIIPSTHFLDTIKGVATLRAFGWTEESISFNNTHLDTSQRPAYLLSMVQRWLAFVLGMVTAVIAVLVVTLATQLRPTTGFTGASMVSLMTFGRTLANLVQMYTLLETSIGAVGRLKSFNDNTAPEDLPGEDHVPPASWPEKGRIVISDVSATYGYVTEFCLTPLHDCLGITADSHEAIRVQAAQLALINMLCVT